MRKQSRIDLVSVSLKQQTTHRMEEQIIEPAELTQIRPSKRQLQWQQLEFYGFIHFGLNTMTNREWGLGNESPTVFDPQNLDCHQWVSTMKQSGMQGIILTCKHHDGFCLWPSQHTAFTVASTPWRNGQGDLVKELSDACRQADLKFGIYLSPWDQHEACYGMGQAYDDFYTAQLTELLTNYGDIFEIWLDGANGEGPNGKRQNYVWERYYQVIRELQPNAVIAICGPDVRWVGNEAGQTRLQEWSVVPAALKDAEKTASHSQKADSAAFRQSIFSMEMDLGSRQALKKYGIKEAAELAWYPAEVNLSIRPGWFYHPSEDQQVKSGAELWSFYKQSVGGNSSFLLNVPPMPDGMIHPTDQKALQQLGHSIKQLKEVTTERNGTFASSSTSVSSRMDKLQLSQAFGQYWKPDLEDKRPWLTLHFAEPVVINTLVLKEAIQYGQRVEKAKIFLQTVAGPQLLTEIVTIGYQKIISFEAVGVSAVKIVFTQVRQTPIIQTMAARYVPHEE